MNPAERLLALYDRVAEAPEAVPRLRRFVLDLAVRGKLVEQDLREGHGDDLKRQIQNAWKQHAFDSKVKKVKTQAMVSKEDIPFEIPSNWGIVRLGEAMDLINGRAFKPEEWTSQGLPIVRIQNLNNNSAPFNRFNGNVKPKFLIDTGDFLISWSGTPGTSFGAHIWGRGPAVLNQHIFKAILLGEAFDKAFLQIAINSRLLELIEQAHGGVGLRHITKPKLEATALTLPPLAEQYRIVAKANEMIALCDRIEASREKREKNRDRLTKASLCRLSRPDTDLPTFRSHARFAIKVLPTLTSRADQIKQLRQSILDLAVRGKLVEQDPADEPASELLKRIAAEKARLAHPRKTRGLASPESFSINDYPFQLPATWVWTRVADIGVLSPRNRIDDDRTASFVPMPLIPAEWGKANTHKSRPWGEIKKGYTHFAEGDVGLAKITPCFENRKSVVFQNLAGGVGSGTTELHIVRPVLMNANYMLLFLKSSLFIENGISKMTGTAGQKRVPKEYFANSPFPLPPLVEQCRIVTKVDELMTFCDRIEADLEVTSKSRQRCLDLFVQNVL